MNDELGAFDLLFRSLDIETTDKFMALRTIGYGARVSIEHEDSLASSDEGLEKAVRVLKAVILSEPAGKAWWT